MGEIMNNSKSAVICAIIFIGSVVIARADDTCNALLSGGVFDTRSSTGSAQFYSAFQSFFCSHATRSNAGTVSGGLQIIIPGYGPLGGDVRTSNENKELNDLCSSSGSTQALSQETREKISVASKVIVDGFNECMKRAGVNAYTLYSPAPSTFNIALSYLRAGTGANFIEVEHYEPTNATCRIEPRSQISNSISYFACQREDQYKGSQVIVYFTEGLTSEPLTINPIEKPWTPRKINGSAPTSKPGENINIYQSGVNFQWDLQSHNPQGNPAFSHSLTGYFTSESNIVGRQIRKNVDPHSPQYGCRIVQLLDGMVPQDYVINFVMKNAPASEQPPGTIQTNGKFCDLDADWSNPPSRLNIQ
jgi:hypothetical protein